MKTLKIIIEKENPDSYDDKKSEISEFSRQNWSKKTNTNK